MNDHPKIFTVLFLCTGNSARSIIAESIMNRVGAGKFVAYSAGSMPTGKVNLNALYLLARLDFPTADLRSKSWEEFAATGAPKLDFIITVCDNAAGEVCPIWPGQPMTAHWGIPDPAAVAGSPVEIQAAFNDAFRVLNDRLTDFANLPLDKLDGLSLKRRMEEIGAKNDATERT